MIIWKKILESTRYLGYYYGTPREFIIHTISKGLNLVLCLDIKGALFIKKAFHERAVRIFVKPPSLGVARSRILSRCAATHLEELKGRLNMAAKELSASSKYEYSVVNDNLNKAVKEVKKIIKWTISQ